MDVTALYRGPNAEIRHGARNLKRLCEQQLAGRYKLEIIDLLEHPERAKADQIVAIPTLVRQLPAPLKRIIGDLSNKERVIVGLELDPAE